MTRTARGAVRPAAAPGRPETLVVQRPAGPLEGTLLLPAGTGPWPTVLLLPGSGPVDRDSDARRMPLGITRALAEALAAAGVASYRYDKRGVGRSPGDWRVPGLHDGADDARAVLQALAGHPAVDAARVVVVGHSEGAVVAGSLAAAPTAPDAVPLAGVVLLSPSARRGEDLLVWQAEQVVRTLPRPVSRLLRLLRKDLVADVRRNHARLRRTTTDVARVGGLRVNARWHREFLDHDPAEDLRRVSVPVLAVGGAKDLQSHPDDVARVADLVAGPVRTHLLPDLSHLLRHQPRPASFRLYREEVRRPVDPRVLDLVAGWVTGTVGAAAPG